MQSVKMSSDVESDPNKEARGRVGDQPNYSRASWKNQKKDLPGTPTPERASPCQSPGSNASDDTCSICLGHVTDKSTTDSCFHSFCFVCLKEWSKQKAVCPLCKSSFKKIMYDIKSESDFKEWVVPAPTPDLGLDRGGYAGFEAFLNAETRRFFGYRTTMHYPGAGAASLRRLHAARSNSIPDAIPSFPRQRRSRHNLRGSTMFRLSVYLNNVWVQPLADITGRYRQTSPELYREQPALTHRLVPWVNRELAALLPPSRVGVVLTEVMDLIERFPINSHQFRSAMRQYLNRRTRHFVHEFYHFARSPYDMVGHDNAARYIPRYSEIEGNSDNGNSDDDSDAVVEVDSTGIPITSTSMPENGQNQPSLLGNVAREETLTHEGSVVISSGQSSDSDAENSRPNATDARSYEVTQNPEPPLSAIRRLVGRARDFLQNVNEGASTSRQARATGSNSNNNEAGRIVIEASDSNDSDACIIVEEVVPRAPTPELIEIDSEEDCPSSRHQNSLDATRESLSSISISKSRKKAKPKLKRHNFTAENTRREISHGESNVAQDHSYCTEDGSNIVGMPVSLALPSTSGLDHELPIFAEFNGLPSDDDGIYRSNSRGFSDGEDGEFVADIPWPNQSQLLDHPVRPSKMERCSDRDSPGRYPTGLTSSSEDEDSFHSSRYSSVRPKDRSYKNYIDSVRDNTQMVSDSRPSTSNSASGRDSRTSVRDDRTLYRDRTPVRDRVWSRESKAPDRNSKKASKDNKESHKERKSVQESKPSNNDSKTSIKLPKKDLKAKVKKSKHTSSTRHRSSSAKHRSSSSKHSSSHRHRSHSARRKSPPNKHGESSRAAIDEASAEASSHHQKVVRDSSSYSSGEPWLPPPKKVRTRETSKFYRERDVSTSSVEDHSEQKSTHHSCTKYRISSKTKKSLKKKKKRSRDKHKETKQKKKHRQRSKSKKKETMQDSDSDRKRHRSKSAHKRKRSKEESSDSESSSSYVKYKETTFKVRILNEDSSTDSSDTLHE